MKLSGNLRKLRTKLSNPVHYELPVDDESVPLNPLLGQSLSLRFTGPIHCVHCGRESTKSFNQGFCYPCFTSLAQCDMCILKPEQCHFHKGTCREPEWAKMHCMQAHFVYLANTSTAKVGITRHTQIPTRWIDQGAVQALPVLKVDSRYQAGLIEVEIKQYVSDRTSWQKMLKNEIESIELTKKRDQLLKACDKKIAEIENHFGAGSVEHLVDQIPLTVEYPVLEYPDKVKSLNFDKTPEISGTLMGIKGQYLIFDIGVINIRKFGGYHIEMNYS